MISVVMVMMYIEVNISMKVIHSENGGMASLRIFGRLICELCPWDCSSRTTGSGCHWCSRVVHTQVKPASCYSDTVSVVTVITTFAKLTS